MKTDYPELEGIVVKYNDDNGIRRGLIVGCNYNVGVTIINSEDKDNYIACLMGPSSSIWPQDGDKGCHRKIFHGMVKLIKKGEFSYDDLVDLCDAAGLMPGSGPKESSCPYGQ